MESPTIAIIGSPWLRDANGDRLQDASALAHEAAALAAGEELGRELAASSCRLLVYSAEDHSIERAVVKGYVAVRKEKDSIEFRHPHNSTGRFAEQALPEEVINDRVDAADDFVPSFYRSLRDADGVLLLGGRVTVLIAGHVAIAFQRPVAAVACFGGSAAEIWRDLEHIGGLTSAEFDAMGRPWTASSASSLVRSLLRRHGESSKKAHEQRTELEELAKYRQKESQGRAERPALLTTGVSFVAVLIAIVLCLSHTTTGGQFAALFIAALTLAGTVGSCLTWLRSHEGDHLGRVILFGAVAGFVFSILYLVPQLAGEQSLLSATTLTTSMRLQILIAPILALAGGLAAESVLSSLRASASSRGAPLPSLPPGTTGGVSAASGE